MIFTTYRRLSDYQVTPDGQRFLLAPDAPREAGAIGAVLNWQALLRTEDTTCYSRRDRITLWFACDLCQPSNTQR